MKDKFYSLKHKVYFTSASELEIFSAKQYNWDWENDRVYNNHNLYPNMKPLELVGLKRDVSKYNGDVVCSSCAEIYLKTNNNLDKLDKCILKGAATSVSQPMKRWDRIPLEYSTRGVEHIEGCKTQIEIQEALSSIAIEKIDEGPNTNKKPSNTNSSRSTSPSGLKQPKPSKRLNKHTIRRVKEDQNFSIVSVDNKIDKNKYDQILRSELGVIVEVDLSNADIGWYPGQALNKYLPKIKFLNVNQTKPHIVISHSDIPEKFDKEDYDKFEEEIRNGKKWMYLYGYLNQSASPDSEFKIQVNTRHQYRFYKNQVK